MGSIELRVPRVLEHREVTGWPRSALRKDNLMELLFLLDALGRQTARSALPST